MGAHATAPAPAPDDPDPDEYGYVPRQFLAINEFPVRYWSEIIDHNYYVYADLTDFVDHITWHPIPDTQLLLGCGVDPEFAILSDTKDIPRGVSLYSYDINAFDDVVDSPTIISMVSTLHGINPENVIVYSQNTR